MNTFVVYILHTDRGTYLGRTTNISERLIQHNKTHKINKVITLGKYPDISIKGFGKLSPRMEYYWYNIYGGNINKVIPGSNYYKRDQDRYINVIEEYDNLNNTYNLLAV